ncbi:hypothetical protein FDECE_12246 [Fusarium decemcellulare]|nr:hypothetical protein FDECE_12246 [Fusarium decemcellulare]
MNSATDVKTYDNSQIHVGNNIYGPDLDDQCLAGLRTTDPRDDKSRIEDTKGGLLKDAYYWILANTEFQKWHQDEQSRLLWIKGDPGKGKTMLVCGIINELEEQSKDLLSYFFCQGTDSRSNTATSVLRGLIYRLVAQQRSLIQHVRNKTHGDPSIFDGTNGWYAASDIFRIIVQDENLKPSVLIIDALDECEVQLEQLLKLIIDTLSPNHRIKWIVSSRNQQHVGRVLDAANIEGRVMLSLEMNSALVSDAVGIYIRNQVSKLQTLQNEPNLRGMVEETIFQKANGTFLWVALVFKRLRVLDDEKFEDSSGILTALEEAPTELTDLYSRMFQQIQRLGSNNSRLCKTILATMFIACRPLHVLELPILSGFEGNLAKTDTVERLIKLCGSFLTLQKETNVAYFIHQSAKDFLADDSTAFGAIFQFGKGKVHRDLFFRSIQALKKTLRRNMYDLLYSGVLIDEITKPDPDPLARDRDAAPCLKGGEEVQMVHGFIENCYLYWLEAASLYGGVTLVVSEIRRLKDLAKANRWEGLENLVHDAHRFALSHRHVIETAPLQVYVSALIFSPTSSLVRRRFEPLEGPTWITKKPTMQPEWDACLLTLEGHWGVILSISFTTDGKILASGSDDGIIRVWDSSTGAFLKSWNAHDGKCVSAVAFAPGWPSTILASGGDDKLIKIWDAAADYTLLCTLKGHEKRISNVSFIDGNTLLSLSDDKTMRKWDLAAGTLLSAIYTYGEPLAVSSNVRYVATQASRYFLDVSELNDFEEWPIAFCGSMPQYCDTVTFFPDNTKLVSSGFKKDEAKIWDLATDSCLYTFAGCMPIAISPDGTRIASASTEQGVKIWDSAQGSLLQTLQGNRHVMELSFSSDGKRLASSSPDIIRIWDPAIEPSPQFLHNANNLDISPNGLWIASTGEGEPIKIWDAATSELDHTIENTDDEDLITFSPDNLWMATGLVSVPRTVRVFKVRRWEAPPIYLHHPSDVYSFAFSPDSLWLASGLRDGTITMRDARTWEHRHTLHSHQGAVMLVTFSPQAGKTLLASSAFRGHINIWAVDTGTLLQALKSSELAYELSFSPNGSWLTINCHDNIEIWDVYRGELLKTVAGMFNHMSWYLSENSLLLSKVNSPGTKWQITKTPDGKGLVCGGTELMPEVHLSSDRAWILVRGKRAIWLPAQYRPKEGVQLFKPEAITGHSGIGFISETSRVLFFQFGMPETDFSWA